MRGCLSALLACNLCIAVFLMPLIHVRAKNNCPRRVLAQTAKTRGGTLEAPAYREENIAVPEKISIFENTARKGLPKSTQRIAESLLGVE